MVYDILHSIFGFVLYPDFSNVLFKRSKKSQNYFKGETGWNSTILVARQGMQRADVFKETVP